MKTLKLTLKKEWFDLINSGEKTEEYREIKEYWVKRLVWIFREMDYLAYDEMLSDLKNPLERHHSLSELEKFWLIEMGTFNKVEFKNGYAKTAPTIVCEFKGIEIRTGNPKWGALENETYFVIKLGSVTERYNC